MRWDLGLGREVGFAFWAMAFLEASFGAYMGIWPLWIERLGAPVTIVGLVLGSSGLLRLAFLAPAASLAERFGSHRLIVASRALAGLGMVAAALATHWTHLLLMVLGGAIGELAFPLTQTHVATHAGANPVRAFTLVFSIGPSLALGLAPLISGALVAVWGMRAAFVLAAMLTAASVALFAGLRGGSRGAARPTAETAPSTYREALRDVPVRRILGLQAATIFALAIGTSFIPTFLDDQRGISPSRIATLGAAAALGSIAVGLIVTRVTRLQRSPLAGVSGTIALTVTGFAIFWQTDQTWLIVLAFVCRGGLFSAWTLFTAALGATVSLAHRARSFAMGEMAGGLAFSLAPMLGGVLYAGSPSLPFAVAAVAGFCLIPLVLQAQRSVQRHAEGRLATAGADSV